LIQGKNGFLDLRTKKISEVCKKKNVKYSYGKGKMYHNR